MVRLDYTSLGRRQSETAPLKVTLDADALYVEAYEIRLMANNKDLTVWFADPATENFDSQVLRNSISGGRPKLPELLRDSIVRSRMTDGLAGPPPQLDWLLSPEPMKGLFADGVQIKYDDPITIDNRQHFVVAVNAAGDKYRFVIDSKTSLIHEVQLPQIESSLGFGQDLQLTLVLGNASFDAPDQKIWQAAPVDRREVANLIAIPPLQPARALGTTANSFSVVDRSGQLQLTNRGTDREATVIFFSERNREPMHSALGFAAWFSAVPQAVRQRMHPVLVANRDTIAALPPNIPLPVVEESKQSIHNAFSRDDDWNLVIVDRSGTIAWMQQVNRPSDLVTLGPILSDVINGIDVPDRLRKQWRADMSLYRKTLDIELKKFKASRP